MQRNFCNGNNIPLCCCVKLQGLNKGAAYPKPPEDGSIELQFLLSKATEMVGILEAVNGDPDQVQEKKEQNTP